LDLDPEGSGQLRIQDREDANKSKPADIRLEIQDIVRIETDSLSLSNYVDIQPVKSLSVVLKNRGGDPASFDFEAESLVDRDAIISAMLALIDTTKTLAKHQKSNSSPKSDQSAETAEQIKQSPGHGKTERTRTIGNLSPLKRTHIHGGTPISQATRAMQSTGTPHTPGEMGTETSLVYFDFKHMDSPLQGPDNVEQTRTPKNSITLPSLNDLNEKSPGPFVIGPRNTHDNLQMDRLPTIVSNDSEASKQVSVVDDDIRDIYYAAAEGDDMRDIYDTTSDGKSHDPKSGPSQHTESDIKEEKDSLGTYYVSSDSSRDASVLLTGGDFSDSEEWNGSRPGTVKTVSALHDDESINRSLNALASVDDAELVFIANQIADPWCTDDICTLALKDITDACKSIFDMKHQVKEEMHAQNENQRGIVEDYISGALGAPSAMASLLSVGHGWNAPARAPASSGTERNRFRNRAGVRDAQALKWQLLRGEMTFVAAEKVSREKMQYVQTVNSSDDVDWNERKNTKGVKLSSMLSDQADSASIFQLFSTQTPAKDPEDEILYYDSDPEFARARNFSKGSRRALAEKFNVVKPTEKPRRRRTLSGIPLNCLAGTGRRLKNMDDGVVSEIIEVSVKEFSLVSVSFSLLSHLGVIIVSTSICRL
jgi:hypothetical protein